MPSLGLNVARTLKLISAWVEGGVSDVQLARFIRILWDEPHTKDGLDAALEAGRHEEEDGIDLRDA